MKTLAPFPHTGSCATCRAEKRCNYCGARVDLARRCTNGRCPWCHEQICTTGGATTSGHGFGAVGGSHFMEDRK